MRVPPPLLATVLLLAACASAPPRPGDAVDAVIARVGPPTAEFSAPDGSRRLEYASGPFGRQTWIARFDARGVLQSWENVLDEAHFARIGPGMTHEQVRAELGPPARIWAVRYHDQTVWSYRFEATACRLFHVGLTPGGVVEDTSYGPDPQCERDLKNR